MQRDFDSILKGMFYKTSPFVFCVILFVLSRILFFTQASIVVTAFHLNLPLWHWFWQWDSSSYAGIVEHGYETSMPSPANMAHYVFFPLLPLLVLGVMKLTHLPIEFVGQLVPELCLFGSMYLLYQLLMFRLRDESVARFGTLLLAFSPCNIYFASFYTESVFLFFSLLALLAAFENRLFLAACAGAILSATHANGVLVLIPLLWITYKNGLSWRILWLVLVPTGLIAYMIYLQVHVGDALAFAHDQVAWGRPGILHYPQLHGKTFGSVLALLVSIYGIYRLTKLKLYPEALYWLFMILPIILSGSLAAFIRLSLCLLPFYVFLPMISQNKPYLKVFLLCLFFALGTLFVALWVNGLNLY